VTSYTARDERAEARYVVQRVEELLRTYAAGDIAVFYRTNAQSRAVEEELVRARLAYNIVGSTRFYDRKEIKDVLAYLRVVANPQDGVSLLRIINVPPRGIGKTTIDALEHAAAHRQTSITAVAADAANVGLSPPAAARLAEFNQLCARLRALSSGPVTTVVRAILAETGYQDHLQGERNPEAEARVENIEELLTVTEQFDAASDDPSLSAFLEQIALMTDVDTYAAARERVTLMTLHNSKGLEFPVVFIVGLEEGLFPHERSLPESDAIEEERRLCYVGVTRARQRLFLVCARRRHLFGRVEENLPSRFLGEIPEHLVQREEARASGFDEPRVDYAYSQLPEYVPRASSGARVRAAVAHDPNAFTVGQHVRHAEFGEGVVRAVDGSGDHTKLIVRFERVGIKKLMARYAALQRVNHL
jgi:DNA helicase-2/ATP-dependent DNA helicase PcrA